MNDQSKPQIPGNCGCEPSAASALPTIGPPAVIRELVQQFHVSWTTLPEVIPVGRDKHRIGFLLQLQTTHEHLEYDAAKDCAHCQRARAVLRIVADCIVGFAKRSCACALEVQVPFVTVTTNGIPGVVQLGLRVVHHNDCVQHKSDCEACWLKEMQDQLTTLGATPARPQANPKRSDEGPTAKAAVSGGD